MQLLSFRVLVVDVQVLVSIWLLQEIGLEVFLVRELPEAAYGVSLIRELL